MEAEKMNEFMEGVRALVAPRLMSRERELRVSTVPLLWKPQGLIDLVTLGPTFGECFATTTQEDMYPPGYKRVVLYSNNLRWWNYRVRAFVLIHELAHVAALNGGHDKEWAAVARQMGIKEMAYEEKGPDYRGCFLFLDPELEKAVYALPSYRADVGKDIC